MLKIAASFLAYLSMIPLANWLIANWGFVCVASGPCLIPVGFGLMAPSGLIAVGFAFFFRDTLQLVAGKTLVYIAIATGCAISFLINPVFAIASSVAFLVSESLDFFVFSRLRNKGVATSILASGFVGSVADSVIFNQIAFASQQFTFAQIIGKWEVTLVCVGIYILVQRLRERV